MVQDMERVVNNIHVGSGKLEIERNGSVYPFEISEGGGTFTLSRDVQFVEVDEAVGRVAAYIVGESANFQLNSLELDAVLLKEAIGQGEITTTETEDGEIEQVLTFGGSSFVNVSQLTYTVPRRINKSLNIIIELYKVVSVADVETVQSKSDPTTYPVVFEALNDLDREEGAMLGKITVEKSAEEAELGFFDVVIDETESDSSVDQGETLTIVADIENTGTEVDEQTIELEWDSDGTPEVVDSTTIEILGGQTQQVTLTYDVPSDESAAEYTVTVQCDDSSDTVSVTVNEVL